LSRRRLGPLRRDEPLRFRYAASAWLASRLPLRRRKRHLLPTSATDSPYQHPSSRSSSQVRSQSRVSPRFASPILRRSRRALSPTCQPLVGSAEASPRSDRPRLQSLAEIAKRRKTTVTGNPASGGDAFDGAISSFAPVHPRPPGKKVAPRSREGDITAALSTARDADHVTSDALCRTHVFLEPAMPSSWSCEPEPLLSRPRQRS